MKLKFDRWMARRVAPAILGLTVCYGASAQSFRPVGPMPTFAAGVWRDINGDGAPDLIKQFTGFPTLPNPPPDTGLTVVMNDGTGRFGMPIYVPLPPNLGATHASVGEVVLLDLEGDGDLDAVGTTFPLSGKWPAPLVAYIRDRSGFTADAIDRFAGASFNGPSALRSPDVDGDGASDLVLMTFDRVANRMTPHLLLNDGRGYFTEVHGRFPVGSGWLTYEFADLDRDGDVDCVVGTGWGIPNIALSNDGAGRFTETFYFSQFGVHDLRIQDFDGDGFQDVLLPDYGGIQPPGMQIWINDRAGGFRYEPSRFRVNWQPGQPVRRGVQLADLDGDGDLDIFCRTYPVEEFFLNDGTGHFTDGRAALGVPNVLVDGVIDLDRDGDADLLQRTPLAQAYYTWHANTARHVFCNDPPTGGVLQVDVYGEPGRFATYVLGFVRRDLLIPGIGWAGLDPTFSVAWPNPQVVPSSRTVTMTLPIPADPYLRGVGFWAQSVEIDVHAGLRLANVWPITIR